MSDQTNVAAVVASMPAPVSIAATPAAAIPTVSDQVTIDLGSFASMFLTQIAPAVAEGLGIGVEAVISTMPMGSILSDFIGPQVIAQYVSKGLTVAESVLSTSNVTIPAPTDGLASTYAITASSSASPAPAPAVETPSTPSPAAGHSK